MYSSQETQDQANSGEYDDTLSGLATDTVIFGKPKKEKKELPIDKKKSPDNKDKLPIGKKKK